MLTSKRADNWVDRGEPPEPKLRLILAHFLGCPTDANAPWLEAPAAAVMGMVAAGSSEVQVGGYLRVLARERGLGAEEMAGSRLVAVALWHAGKAALVRDLAERVLRGELPAPRPTEAPLAEWLAQRLLTPEELEDYHEESAHLDQSDRAK